MASIFRRGEDQPFILQFTDDRGERKTVSLGTRSERDAKRTLEKIENILSAKQLGDTLDVGTAAWLAKLQDGNWGRGFLARLAAAGLVDGPRAEPAVELRTAVQDSEASELREPAAPAVLTLGKMVAEYIARRSDVKQPTLVNWGHTQRNLIAFFPSDKPLEEISVADAKDFERYLKTTARSVPRRHKRNKAATDQPETADANRSAGKPLSLATRQKRISNAKQFFQDAVDRRLIPANPFAGLESGNPANEDRQFFVTLEMASSVLEVCPTVEWKLVFALCRFGGLRCPSEVELLRVEDILWDKDRFLVHSPKTEHHKGKGTRWVPIFPELRPYLSAAWDQAEPGQKYLVTLCRDKSKDYLRKTMEKIIRRAGLPQWPKLFQNLRSSRQTELEDAGFPSHVVCAWIGNSPQVARKHYLQVTDDHFNRATGGTIEKASDGVGKALQNCSGTASQGIADGKVTPARHSRNPMISARHGGMSHGIAAEMGVTGLGPVTETSKNIGKNGGRTGFDPKRCIFVCTGEKASRLAESLAARPVDLSDMTALDIRSLLDDLAPCASD